MLPRSRRGRLRSPARRRDVAVWHCARVLMCLPPAASRDSCEPLAARRQAAPAGHIDGAMEMGAQVRSLHEQGVSLPRTRWGNGGMPAVHGAHACVSGYRSLRWHLDQACTFARQMQTVPHCHSHPCAAVDRPRCRFDLLSIPMHSAERMRPSTTPTPNCSQGHQSS